MKDVLGGQIIKESVGLKAKTYSYLKDNNDEEKKRKETKKWCVMKRKLTLNFTVQKQLKLKIKQTIQKKRKFIYILTLIWDRKAGGGGGLILPSQVGFPLITQKR